MLFTTVVTTVIALDTFDLNVSFFKLVHFLLFLLIHRLRLESET